MNVYYLNLILILGLAYPLCIYKPSKMKKAVYLFVTFGFMWFLAAFRYDIGYDYINYLWAVDWIRDSPDFLSIFQHSFEPGFSLVTRAMGFVASSETPVLTYGIYSFLIFAPIAISIYLYCEDAWLSTWLFVVLTYFYSSMNFVRQNIACGVALLGYKFLRDRRPIPYFLVVLAAASFHKTALIMIPLYFISLIPLNTKSMIAYGVAITAVYLTSPVILDKVTDCIFTTYKGDVYIEEGFSLIFLLIPTVLLITCLALFPIWKKRDPNANMLTSMMIFSWMFWLMITRHFVLERFSHYSYMLMMIAIPAALRTLLAPQADSDKLVALETQARGRKAKLSKSETAEIRTLRNRISDHKKYYWSAVISLLLITFFYHEYGQYINGTNGFHNVFPYQSVIPWLNG